MTSDAWDPPLTTGLSGDRYLETDLLDGGHVDDLAESHGPGCYALRLSRPDPPDADRIAHEWFAHFEVRPPFFDRLVSASALFYVGAATNVFDRLTDHVDGEVRRAALLRVFPPHHVERVWLEGDPDRAFEVERQRADALAREYPDAYVHVR